LIAQHTKATQKVERLWLQSMTPQAIKDGFGKLRSDEELMNLANAARCRSESDWLIGINGTRAMTAFNSKSGGFFLTTVGRVQTPTLSIVVEREELIRKFISRDYWEVTAEFICAAGIYQGRWFDPRPLLQVLLLLVTIKLARSVKNQNPVLRQPRNFLT
jgi:DNA topoisomerase-3